MDKLFTKKLELKSLLPKEGIQATILELKNFLNSKSDKYDTLLIIESHFIEVWKNQQEGTMLQEMITYEMNKTRKRLIEFINNLDERDTVLTIFIDPRDGEKYKIININGKVWIADNLRYKTKEISFYYKDSEDYGLKYGRLYTWNAAQEACPHGWRLPTIDEWISLSKELDLKKEFSYDSQKEKDIDYFFENILGGFGDGKGYFSHINEAGNLWSSSELQDDKTQAWYSIIGFMKNRVSSYMTHKYHLLSCRYIKK